MYTFFLETATEKKLCNDLVKLTIQPQVLTLALSSHQPVTLSAGAGVTPGCVYTHLCGITLMGLCLTLINVWKRNKKRRTGTRLRDHFHPGTSMWYNTDIPVFWWLGIIIVMTSKEHIWNHRHICWTQWLSKWGPRTSMFLWSMFFGTMVRIKKCYSINKLPISKYYYMHLMF